MAQKHVRDLLASENLGKLIEAQRHLDKAADLYADVFRDMGAPSEQEEEQEAFFDAMATIAKRMERLIGRVVYVELFVFDPDAEFEKLKESGIRIVETTDAPV